jgi:hypothetical protein
MTPAIEVEADGRRATPQLHGVSDAVEFGRAFDWVRSSAAFSST